MWEQPLLRPTRDSAAWTLSHHHSHLAPLHDLGRLIVERYTQPGDTVPPEHSSDMAAVAAAAEERTAGSAPSVQATTPIGILADVKETTSTERLDASTSAQENEKDVVDAGDGAPAHTESAEDDVGPPPDGGFEAWSVVASSVLLLFAVFGFSRSLPSSTHRSRPSERQRTAPGLLAPKPAQGLLKVGRSVSRNRRRRDATERTEHG